MIKSLTTKELKELDKFTIQKIGIPSLVLMERASLAIRDITLAQHYDLSKVVIVAGYGNNGGDGLAVARLLKIKGVNVSIINVGNAKHESSEHATQSKICDYYKIPTTSRLASLSSATLVIDAIFGVGIDRPVTGEYLTAIQAINHSATTVSIDVPSGLNSDTGIPLNEAVHADLTIAIAFNKLGFNTNSGKEYTGKVIVADDMGIYYF
ncbi:sugar kinase [Paucilactobacillus oligofermentans DSM 15707 = LMG 22743]|uniref:NAD(P)H-hydrate epimerase n=1 Tax=Paucilactobacillus oligofermentans DSM 15707 = LMG 22743 TaxID=1423778 RepID=A0A0R1RGR6_9LACO|nr:NAD(P)H-hydrate epimerase [Paucilactobacillus oligofermentans]KRL55550.1 sugar kinase [Paucilactobacillus oligofermentans DSM 15707 = LMG 22743]CUS25462.1 YjeF-like protein [Paucilactobacillus oligofermentans DSM 15707 = LMG 22743]